MENRHDPLVLVYATDTFYAMGVNPGDEEAVKRVFEIKGRREEAALPLIADSLERVLARAGTMSLLTHRLAEAYWPGPLTLILDAPPWIAPSVHGGRGTIAVRVPAWPPARALAATHGGFLTATSANRSGHPPARSIEELGELARDPRVRTIDGGPTPGGAPSTIVDARGAHPILVRDGAIAWSRVLESSQK